MQVFDTTTWERTALIHEHKSPVLGLAFLSDGQRLASAVAWAGPKKRTHIHDLSKSPPELVHNLPGQFVTDASPQDDLIAAYEPGAVNIWNPSTDSGRVKILTPAGWLNSLRFSADGSRIATAGFEDRVAAIWDCKSGKPLMRGPHTVAVQAVAIDPQGRYWASAGIDGQVKVWHYHIPEETTVVRRKPDIDRVFAPAGSPKEMLVLAGDGPAEGVDIETGSAKPFPPVTHLRRISGDGQVLVAAIRSTMKETADTVQIWDRTTAQLRHTWLLPDERTLYYGSIAISKTGSLLATRSEESPIHIWDLSGSKPREVCQLKGFSMTMAFSPDEKLLAAACQFGKVKMWNLDEQKELPELQGYESGSDWAHCVCFSSDGRLVAAGNSAGVVQVWDAATGKLKAKLKGHLTEIRDVIFLPGTRRWRSPALARFSSGTSK